MVCDSKWELKDNSSAGFSLYSFILLWGGGSDLVISSFAYMLIDMKSIKVCCLLFYMCSANLTVWPDLCLF